MRPSGINLHSMRLTSEEIKVCIDDRIKGIICMLDYLELSNNIGEHRYQKNAYRLISIALEEILKNSDDIKEKCDYINQKVKIKIV